MLLNILLILVISLSKLLPPNRLQNTPNIEVSEATLKSHQQANSKPPAF